MATYSRTDNSASRAPTRQKPIVLARLPRIGSKTAQTLTPETSQSYATPSPGPAPAAVIPPPETLPHLELRGQIEDRIKLHVAEPLEEQSGSPTVYFADHEHVLAQEPKVAEAPPTARTSSPKPKPRSRSSQARPLTVSEKLFELHNQISPYAGLIVALALIASAGLLYWLSVGPTQLPTPHFDNFGVESPNEGLGYDSHSLPEQYVPQFTAELPKLETAQSSDDQWKEIELPTLAAPATPTQLPPLEQDTAEPQAQASSESSPYPRSLAAEPLDFARVKSSPQTLQTLGKPIVLPEVARRANETTNR